MTINLKQIRTLDTDNIKLDKINYNFDQLIVNGGGPKGAIGPDGNTGPQGFQGAQGFQGDRGVQGVQGPDAASAATFWSAISQNFVPPADNMATLFAKHPIPVATTAYPAVVGAGYITGIAYNNQQPNNGLPKYQWVINRIRNNVVSNLRFTSEGVSNAFDITMDNFSPQSEPPLYKLRLGFIDNQNSQLNLQSLEHIITSTATGATLLKVSDDVLTNGIYTDSFFQNPVTFNQKLSVGDSGADANKIATAIDNTGEVVFKTTEELGGSVKIGTIISILPSIFSDPTRFICSQTIDSSIDPNNPLKIRMGAGIGDYIGWYVCNGQSWTDGTVQGTILVPDLNSYSYQIVGNPISTDSNSQGSINIINDEVHLIGGANIEVIAAENGVSSAIYDNILNDNSVDPQITVNNTGNPFSIKKLPQIIYLGATNLYWSQKGTGQSAIGDYSSTDYSVVDYNAF